MAGISTQEKARVGAYMGNDQPMDTQGHEHVSSSIRK